MAAKKKTKQENAEIVNEEANQAANTDITAEEEPEKETKPETTVTELTVTEIKPEEATAAETKPAEPEKPEKKKETEKKPKNNFGLFLILLLLTNLVWFGVGKLVVMPKYEKAVTEYATKLEALNKEYDELEADYAALSKQADEMLKTIEELTKTAEELNTKLKSLGAQGTATTTTTPDGGAKEGNR